MIKVYEIDSRTIRQSVPTFTQIIYSNFIELTEYSYVKHTIKDIRELLSSEQLFGYIVKYIPHTNLQNSVNSEKIIAYLFGETSVMPDGRNAYYLSYIFVAQKYRHLKIGSQLLSKLIKHCQNLGLTFIVLTCDMSDTKLVEFYEKFGFVLDPNLRRNKKHDVMCLYL